MSSVVFPFLFFRCSGEREGEGERTDLPTSPTSICKSSSNKLDRRRTKPSDTDLAVLVGPTEKRFENRNDA